MTTRIHPTLVCALALSLVGAAWLGARPEEITQARADGPCDIYAAAGTPCVAAHSTTRALSAAYGGPLYQVKRLSDGRTLDVGVVPRAASPMPDAGRYANAAAQDAFCVNALCVITVIYDQSGKGNHLYQAPPGPQFPGPAKGAFDTQPIADMAPITINGHKAYGVYIMPGMGFRNNDASGLAILDEPEGIYYVVDGTHYDNGCCFDYGNASTNGRAVGTGTMETTYFGTSTAWGKGAGPGPWIMADLEAGLFSGYESKENVGSPTIDSWRFVTAVVDGGGGNKWDLRGGNAQQGGLTTFYSGVRPGSKLNSAYFPMKKQGAILLGTGGDNGNGSAGTFYEGVMVTGFPTEATTDAVQANIVQAKYDVERIGLTRVTTFAPRSVQDVTATFTNTTGASVNGVTLTMSAPDGWLIAPAPGSWLPATATTVAAPTGASVAFGGQVAPGATVRTTFRVRSPSAMSAGYLTARVDWTDADRRAGFDTRAARIRNAFPVRINEVRFSASGSTTNQFVELYNASNAAVDVSNWQIINTQTQFAPIALATIPAGTQIRGYAFYLLGLASSGLTAPASAGAATINVRSTTGFEAGQRIEIGGEVRTVATVGTAAAATTTIFIPVSTRPHVTVPVGSTTVPVTTAAGFVVGEKIGIDTGGNVEVATVTAVGKAATQTALAAGASAGATNVKVAATANMTAGDTLTIGTGGRKELVTIATVGTPGANGTGVDLAAALKRDHAVGIDVSDVGTGISFTPATKFAHVSGDAVQALGSGITLDRPLARAHAYGTPVVNAADPTTGYQGPPAPQQWFGAALSGRGGSIALRDATGAVLVDAIVYGSQQSNSSGNGTIASPEIATLEGVQHQGGCIAVVPPVGRGGGPAAAAPAGGANRSLGRYPDGRDVDSLCTDFLLQPATTLPVASAPGATNVKVASVVNFAAGQTVTIDTTPNIETAVIATVGTAGGATTSGATSAGATVIPVTSTAGFSVGQTLGVGSGTTQETVVVTAIAGGGRGGGATITVAAPLTRAHTVGAPVSGSGITFTGPLTRAHAVGAPVAGGLPTPGAPNQYVRTDR
jgi:hypothetical protein